MTTEPDYDRDTPYIVVRTTITVTKRIPFNKEYYPHQASPREACDYERDVEFADKLEVFINALESDGDAYGGASDLQYEEHIHVDWVKAEDTTGNRKDFEYDAYKSHAEWEKQHFPQ